MSKILLFVFILGVLGWSWGAIAAAPENTVIRIKDGDTVVIMGANRTPYTVRLSGLDAPEKGQPYGKKSKQALSAMIYKKIVRVDGSKQDRYGRTIARLYVDGLDVNAAMIEQGAAWVYRRYARGSSFAVFYQAEARAKKNKVGLWALSSPLPPWEWRKSGKK